jgi:hypothetical protein
LLPRRDDDIEDIQREVAVLADCRCDAITQYFASLVEPASSQLLIVMELMAATAADLVRHMPYLDLLAYSRPLDVALERQKAALLFAVDLGATTVKVDVGEAPKQARILSLKYARAKPDCTMATLCAQLAA